MASPDLWTASFYAPQIDAAASRLEHSAAAVRQRAGLLESAAAGCRWDGAGARAFRSRGHETTTQLRRTAAGLDTAATALRRHAGRVADAVAAEQASESAAVANAARELRLRLAHLGELAGIDPPR